MKASEQKQNSIKTEGNETSSDSEDSDSCSDISSSESVRNSQKSHKMVPQFSVLRSESDGLRMKISAVRNVQDTSDKKKTTNNNNDRSSRKGESRLNKKNESRMSSSGSSSSYCSVCSRSDSDDSSTDSQQDKHRKIRLKRKKVHTMSAPAERKPAPVQNAAYPVWTSDKKTSKPPTTAKKPVSEPSVSGSKKCTPQIASDVIPTDCVSSSDTELPALVNAAIKCVESSSEMENCGSEPPLQYNSALLHDFMIKTQMLGSCTEIATLKRKSLVSEEKPMESLKKTVCETPAVCVQQKVPEAPNESKKKRGRPKKQNAPKESQKILVNESLDSGITSTAQSLSPSPNSPAQKESASEKSRESRLTTNGSVELREATAPKISIINLEKQIYATERVLYPPRGRKKSVGKSRSSKAAKSEIDPLWKKIDVNSKFHRPILTGYKSDGGSTVCSKRRRSKSGYVSDFGAAGKHYSGYKSDRSGKSRYSTKSCGSRAKSCDYRSDYSNVSRKSRRKKKSHIKHSKSFSSVNEQDILQLAGLTLGQTSEESSRESLEKTVEEPCSSKKYGEINRFIRTGEYFGGIKKFSDNYKFGSSPSHMLPLDKSIFRSCGPFSGKTYPKSTPVTPIAVKEVPTETERFCTKIRSRRSSAISRCSSMSMVSKYNLKRRRRRKFRTRSQSRYSCIDPKFHIQIEILVNSFATLCRIDGESMSKFSNLKERVDREKKVGTKRSVKKRKLSENLEHYQITNLKRKHKKSGHNSPDEHKLPLKKRHYLLMPGEKCDAKSFHMMEAKNKELCDMKYSLKSTNNNVKVPLKPVTPKKRHLLETPHNALDMHTTLLSKYNTMPCNDLKPLLNSPERITDIVSQKLLNQVKNDIIKKKNRLEGLVSKMQSICSSAGVPTGMSINQVIEKAPPKFPQPGIFEPSSELEIQIPLTKLAAGVITKSEVDSPKVLPDDLDYERTLPEPKTERVVETLLNKTGGHLLMRKKRKKVFNRTGFPTVKKRKRKTDLEPRLSLDSASEKKSSTNLSNIIKNKQQKASGNKTDTTLCDRVPHVGEASTTFLERNKQPRLSVVSLERLQDPNKKRETLELKQNENNEANVNLVERTKKNRSSSVKTKKETPAPLVTDDHIDNNDHSITPIQTQQSTNEAKKIEVNKTEEAVKPENRKLCAKINLRRNTISLHIDNSIVSETPETEEKTVNKIEKTEPNGENFATSLKSRLRQREIENTPKRRNRTKQNQILKPIKPNAILRKPFVKPEMKNAIVRIVRKKIDDAQSSIISDDKLVKKIKIENISNLKKAKVVTKPIKQEKPAETSEESLEQEPLPLNEGVSMENQEQIELNETFPKSKKIAKWKKTYLTAGLLSDTFKIDRQKKLNVKEKFSEEETSEQTSLLPPPPYCEKFFRRTVYDFLLPYDIWWAHTNCKLPARVTVPSWNYRKIRTNVYGDVKPNPVVDHQVCNCKPQSGCGDDCLNRLVYTECFPTSCPSQDKCQNQKIQKHEWAPGIERFMTENKGWGVRTNLAIRKGTYILEYVGEVVTEKEFKRRMATLYVNDTHHYCLNLDGGLVIDGHRMGSDGRFVNHSCSPNCEMQKWSVNGLFRMALFALRNIEPGEELTYDYNFSLFNPSEGQPCRCETPQCRGVIGGKSQRVKPVDTAKIIDPNILNRQSRARKRQAKKNSGRYQSKDVIIPQFQLPSDREKKIIKGSNCFLIRNLEKVQKLKFRPIKSSEIARPLTPSSIAVQISALRVPRNIKTRGLTQAAHDPEVERMAKMAVVFRDICSELENMKDANGKSQLAKLLPAAKRKRNSQDRIKKPLDFATVQTNVEKGLYKQPELFDEDMNKVFSSAITHFGTNTDEARAIDALSKAYIQMKNKAYDQLSKLVNKKSLKNFRPMQENKQSSSMKRTEDIIRCICGLFKDEGLMIQCAKCLCWQHAECTKADTKAEYSCERCVPRNVDYEIPLNEFTEEGYRYYLSLLRGKLQIRQGDTVYVLRDIPIKDENGKTYSTKKHTYETIGEVDYSECDIFRVERMWKNNEGKRFVFGHHYLRPHETFHEPTRKFYENEVVRVPLYEVVPIELVIARCWVLDRGTFCKGRPADCTSEKHVYICELRVDKSARFFSKVRQVYPTCTKEYAFRTFPEKLKISRTYAPHEVDPAMLKSRKRRPEDTPPQQRKNPYPIIQLLPPPAKTMLERRNRLENVLRNIRLRLPDGGEPTAVDLSYLLTGRRARQRKANAASVPV